MRIRSKTSVSSVRTKFYLGLVSILNIVEYIVSINKCHSYFGIIFYKFTFFQRYAFLNFIIFISNGKSA